MTSTVEYALHLAAHTHRIAGHENAGQCATDLQTLVDQIERLINRPVPEKFCGYCPTPTPKDDQKQCGILLYAKRDDTQTTCWKCHTTHNIDQLIEQALEDSDEMSFTLGELYKTILPAVNEHIPLRTLQHWAATSRLVPTGYNTHAEPRYQLAHVRQLRDQKPQQKPTGTNAHKTKAS